MRNNKGFTLFEVLVASTILFTMILLIIPLTSLIKQEQAVLSDRRTATSILHDQLQSHIWEGVPLPSESLESLNQIKLNLSFEEENEYVKGCAKWTNAKQRNESICLYALREK